VPAATTVPTCAFPAAPTVPAATPMPAYASPAAPAAVRAATPVPASAVIMPRLDRTSDRQPQHGCGGDE